MKLIYLKLIWRLDDIIIVRASNTVEILWLNLGKGSWLWNSKNMSPWCQWINQTLLKNELLQRYLSGIFENNFKWLLLQGKTLEELLLNKIRYLDWEIDFKISKVIFSTPQIWKKPWDLFLNSLKNLIMCYHWKLLFTYV